MPQLLRSIYPRNIQQALQASPVRLVMGTAGLTLLLFAPLAWMTGNSYASFNRIQQHEFRLRQISDQITYYDEVLTMSARLSAATGDPAWESRYRTTEPQLDQVIQESIQLAQSDRDRTGNAQQTDTANAQLVALENQAFDLVRQGQPAAAMALLNGEIYAQWKTQYTAGVTQRNAAIQANLNQKVQEYQQQLLVAISISGLSILLLLPAWVMVVRILQQAQAEIIASHRSLAITNQNLEVMVAARSQSLDERNHQLEAAMVSLKTSQDQVIQNEKLAVMGEMVAGVAHEINNPMGFIAGNLQPAMAYLDDLFALLDLYVSKSGTSDPEIRDLIETIDLGFLRQDFPQLITSMQLGISRVETISASLRNFARADQVEKIATDLRTNLEGTIIILRHRLKANGDRPEIPVTTELVGDCTIACFSSQINQVLMNLLANAIDAIDEQYQQSTPPPNAPAITITLIRQTDWVTITIADTAGGMPENVRQRVFDNLFTTKPAGKGTGLGLAISRQIIVEQHQGTIAVDSILGVGTTFTIVLPIALPITESPPNDAARSSTGATTLAPKPIAGS
jgi:signal transduction histidine kinase